MNFFRKDGSSGFVKATFLLGMDIALALDGGRGVATNENIEILYGYLERAVLFKKSIFALAQALTISDYQN